MKNLVKRTLVDSSHTSDRNASDSSDFMALYKFSYLLTEILVECLSVTIHYLLAKQCNKTNRTFTLKLHISKTIIQINRHNDENPITRQMIKTTQALSVSQKKTDSTSSELYNSQ